LKKLTPVFVVDQIEPCLKFWVDRLGFAPTVEVPEGDRLGFVILARDGVEVMYQSRASVAKDVPALAAAPCAAIVYLEVSDVDEVARRLEGLELVVPLRQTWYGMREISVREPGGNVVGFACPVGG
jgi:uncharacterized glyoxalase superfamily protein PhnB